MQEVDEVLASIDADRVPRLKVFNKIDLDEALTPDCLMGESGVAESVWISAEKNLGIDLLLEAIAGHFQQNHLKISLTLPPHEGRLRGELFNLNAVEEEHFLENGDSQLSLYIDRAKLKRLIKAQPEAEAYFVDYI